MVATIELYANYNSDYIVVTVPDVWFSSDTPANKVISICNTERVDPSPISIAALPQETKTILRALLVELLHNYSYNVASKKGYNFSTMGLLATNELMYTIVEQEGYFLHFRLTK
ncbi:MAG TPA: hypothetical protein PKD00_10130 [Burkholderiales bacterium]|nr:hypothetical protein [Burkholderiales bacterium]